MPPNANELLKAVEECPPGREGWRAFEDACTEVLKYLFVPPLGQPQRESRTHSQIDRRDAIFPNREQDTSSFWGLLRRELQARLVLVEYKNYDALDIGADEVDQVRNYLIPDMGKLGIMVCNKGPSDNAKTRCHEVFVQEQKVIVTITSSELRELINIKDRGDDPAIVVMEKVERFWAGQS